MRSIDVLLVEDNPDHAELLLHLLAQHRKKTSVCTVDNGESALSHLTALLRSGAGLPELVFMDIKMPRLNGLNTLSRIKADTALRNLPVVMVTTSANQREREESLALGAISYLTKPLGEADLQTLFAMLDAQQVTS